ncbi:MAG: glycerol-3-phosphate acyltransferase [Desulfosarcina sp.]
MNEWINGLPLFIAATVSAYLAGSLNFAILVFRFNGRDDPRLRGSGNPGASNVYRQAGKGWALVVLMLDVGRAVVVARFAVWLLPLQQVPWIGLALIAGNRFPCFHGFKGGKGVANYLGFSAVLAPAWTALGLLAWGLVFLVWRTPFLSSFAMVFFLAAGTVLSDGMPTWGRFGGLATALFIVACHHGNIRGRWGRQR